MHPEIKQDKPGNCPKCGMNLVSVKAEKDKSASHQQHDGSNPSMSHESHRHSEMVNADLNKGTQSFSKIYLPHASADCSECTGQMPLMWYDIGAANKIKRWFLT